MKEKLIKYWERKEHQMELYPECKTVFLSHAFGALDFAMESINDWSKEEAELINLWNNEWKARLEEKAYEVR